VATTRLQLKHKDVWGLMHSRGMFEAIDLEDLRRRGISSAFDIFICAIWTYAPIGCCSRA